MYCTMKKERILESLASRENYRCMLSGAWERKTGFLHHRNDHA